MNNNKQTIENLSNFRIKSTLGVAIVSIILVTPFIAYNLFKGQYLLSILSLGILAFFALNIWNCIHKRYYPSLIFFSLVPTMIIFITIAFQHMGVVITFWCYPIVLSFYFMLPERQAWISNLVFLGIIYPQTYYILEPSFMIRFAATILGVSAFSAMFMRVITTQQEMLEAQAVTDPLTGLFNRTMLIKTLEQFIHQNHRSGTAMTLIMLDIDHFKKINDTLGHSSGDEVLRGVGKFLNEHIQRRTDKVFRIGGEEFLVLLYDTNNENGIQVAEQLCSEFASQPLLPDRQVTISIGVATLGPDEDWEGWMKRGDANLYQAKLDGRNQVVA